MRKTHTVVITQAGRDHGKVFHITEMPADKWAKWVMRATFAVSRSGQYVPAEFLKGGFAGILTFGMQALTSCSFEDAEPLCDELMRCVGIKPDPKRPEFVRPGGVLSEDFEEAATIFHLYEEVASLHVGFSLAAKIQEFQAAIQVASLSLNTSTSPAPSAASSLPN